MLLTIPWGLSIIAGRVDIVQSAAGTSKANYVNSPKLKDTKKSLLSQPALSHTGVTVSKEVQEGAYIMILTTIPYFLIQVPAFFMRGQSVAEVASGEKYWALSALVICLVGFFWYLRIQLQASKADEARYRRVEYIKDVLRKGDLSLGGALSNMVKTFDNKVEVANGEIQPLQPENKVKECLVEILKLPFQRYDKDKSSKLDKAEVCLKCFPFDERKENSFVSRNLGLFSFQTLFSLDESFSPRFSWYVENSDFCFVLKENHLIFSPLLNTRIRL